jgi:hypothetical protein
MGEPGSSLFLGFLSSPGMRNYPPLQNPGLNRPLNSKTPEGTSFWPDTPTGSTASRKRALSTVTRRVYHKHEVLCNSTGVACSTRMAAQPKDDGPHSNIS